MFLFYFAVFFLLTISPVVRSAPTANNDVLPELGYLSTLFPLQLNNMQQMAEVAMDPVTRKQTLLELYGEASEIVQATGADSVLMEIDHITNDTTVKGKNNSMVVMAVTNPNVPPSHEDLMEKFRLYFVNLTETPMTATNLSGPPASSQYPTLVYARPTMWQIFVDFLRNQANAVMGALMIPLNVATHATQKTIQNHAEWVMSGSSFGSVVSAPVILKAIAVPNILAQKVVDVTSHQVNNIDSFEQQAKTFVDQAILSADTMGQQAKLITDDAFTSMVDGIHNGTAKVISGINNGTAKVISGFQNGTKMMANGFHGGHQMVSDATSRFVIRPIGAFTGFNLNQVGNGIETVGKSFENHGSHLLMLGQRIHTDAVRVISAGATAIAWGMDPTVSFPKPEQPPAR